MNKPTSYRAFIPVLLIVVTLLFPMVSVASDMNKGDTLALDLKTVMNAALEYNHALTDPRPTPGSSGPKRFW